jgi:intracellular septation protein A
MMQGVAILACVAGALLLAWLARPRRAVGGAARALIVAYALLGAWALWFGAISPGGEPEQFRYWKPTILYWTLAAILVLGGRMGWDYPVKILIGTYFVFSDREWKWMNRAFVLAFVILGGLNLRIAFTGSESEWDGFKWACMVNLIAVSLLRFTFLWLDTLFRIAKYVHGRARALLS